MREMTASEASRHFSAVLDSAEHGETIVITRAGRKVATVAPATNANGAEVRALLERWRGHSAFDDSFEDRVTGARTVATAELDSDPWRE